MTIGQILPFNRMPNSKAERNPACGRCSIGHLCFFDTDGAPASLTQAERDRMDQERSEIEEANPTPKDCPIPF